uniref:Uncharacterized protein n=1 Tax=Schistocephalus solidus TaxID=70667 RepID=A0A0X3NI28_SCHSO
MTASRMLALNYIFFGDKLSSRGKFDDSSVPQTEDNRTRSGRRASFHHGHLRLQLAPLTVLPVRLGREFILNDLTYKTAHELNEPFQVLGKEGCFEGLGSRLRQKILSRDRVGEAD